jgi:antitoxin VapB
MALSIKTDEADRLARELARLNGQTLTAAVTRALVEQLKRDRAASGPELLERIEAFVAQHKDDYDRTRPITAEEWDWAGGDGL